MEWFKFRVDFALRSGDCLWNVQRAQGGLDEMDG